MSHHTRRDSTEDDDSKVLDPDQPTHLPPRKPGIPRIELVTDPVSPENEVPRDGARVPQDDELFSLTHVAVGVTVLGLLWEVGTGIYDRWKKSEPEKSEQPRVRIGVSDVGGDVKIIIPEGSPRVRIGVSDVDGDVNIQTHCHYSVEGKVDASKVSLPPEPATPPSEPVTPPSEPATPPRSAPKISPPSEVTFPSSAESKFDQIMDDYKVMEFGDPESSKSWLEQQLTEAGIEVRATAMGIEVVEAKDPFDPAGVAIQLRARGVKDKELIAQVVDEANYAIADMETFIQNWQESLFNQDAPDTTRRSRDKVLGMEIETPTGLVAQAYLVRTMSTVVDSDEEPGFYPTPFTSVFNSASWSCGAELPEVLAIILGGNERDSKPVTTMNEFRERLNTRRRSALSSSSRFLTLDEILGAPNPTNPA